MINLKRSLREQPDIHARLMSRYQQVPEWHYVAIFGENVDNYPKGFTDRATSCHLYLFRLRFWSALVATLFVRCHYLATYCPTRFRHTICIA